MSFHFVFGEPPDEIKEQIAAAHDHNAMRVVAIQHDVHGFLKELDKEQLLTLRALVHGVSGDPAASAFFVGVITALLDAHGVCPCGADHDAELAEVAGGEQPAGEPATSEPTRLIGADTEVMSTEVKPPYPEPTVQERAKMDEYGLDYMAGQGFFCKNCGQRYVSIEDRMLKPPGGEGCGGCITKSKWG